MKYKWNSDVMSSMGKKKKQKSMLWMSVLRPLTKEAD